MVSIASNDYYVTLAMMIVIGMSLGAMSWGWVRGLLQFVGVVCLWLVGWGLAAHIPYFEFPGAIIYFMVTIFGGMSWASENAQDRKE